jgi:signal transduction histidine kinase
MSGYEVATQQIGEAQAPWWRPPWTDVIMAAVLSVLVFWPPLLITVPLAWRRRLPMAAFVAQMVGLAISADRGPTPELTAFVALLLGVYSLAAYYHNSWVSLAVLLTTATWVAVQFGDAAPDMPEWLTSFVLVIPLWLVGYQVRQSRQRADASTSRAERLARERDTAALAAIVQERARIARELHDVVTHNVSVMVIQATAATKVLDTEPDRARDAMRAVERVGQEAMAELRDMLNVLGGAGPGDEPAMPSHPQVRLDQLDGLVDRVRTAGLPVTVEHTGVHRAVPPGVDLAAYRAIQEALTNVLRHAPGAATRIRLDFGAEALLVEVENEPRPGRTPVPDQSTGESGRGLAGLEQRVRFHQGELRAGPRPDGGYLVRVRLPWWSSPWRPSSLEAGA